MQYSTTGSYEVSCKSYITRSSTQQLESSLSKYYNTRRSQNATMESSDNTRCISPCRCGAKTNLLRHANPLQAVVNDLPRADEQRPNILALIGNAEKSFAMRTLFGVQNPRRSRQKQKSCEIYFHLDPRKACDDHPLLLLDWDVRKSCDMWRGTKRNKCYEAGQSILNRMTAKGDIAQDIHTRILSSFVDVFCFFSDDLGGFKQIARRVAVWLEQGKSPTLPAGTLPSMVIITSIFAPRATTEQETRKSFIEMLREETLEDPFLQLSSINILAVQRKGAASTRARFKRVKQHLMKRLEWTQKNKQDFHVSFSATHVAAFFKLAINHFAESANTPFDFVRASRTFNFVASDMHEHFSNFLKYITSTHVLTSFAAPMIASSLLLDSYPPDAHSQEQLPRMIQTLTR
jgi:hypothetical protein